MTKPLPHVINSAEEQKLLDQLKAGEKDALKKIFLDYSSVLNRIAFRIVMREDEAKDIVQDVFLKIWEKRENIVINSSLAAYLKRAVVNTSLNWLDSHKTRSSLFTNTITEEIQADAYEPLQNEELSTATQRALACLPVRTRAVFTLTRFEEMTYREAAAHLDISEKAVEKEMMKALRLLREALKPFLSLLLLGIWRSF